VDAVPCISCHSSVDRTVQLTESCVPLWMTARHSASCRPTVSYTVSGFLPICQNQIQGLFKDFQGPYEGYIRRTKLNQTGTFISIYKQVLFTLNNLTPSSINQKLELSEKFTKCINSCYWNTGLSRHFTNSSTFKDIQTQIQGLSRTRKSPAVCL